MIVAPHARTWPAAVIFDLDGTLAASFTAIGSALNRALRDHGLPEHDLEWTRANVGRGAAELVRRAVGGSDPEVMRSVGAAFAGHYEEIYLDETPPVPGAAAVLARVAAGAGGLVGVVSNKDARLCRGWLEHWDLARHVATVVGPDVTGVRKPDAAALLPAIAALGVRPDEALLVGDMDVDVETGRNAGVAVVAVRGGASSLEVLAAAGALAVLDHLQELPGWLAANGRGWP